MFNSQIHKSECSGSFYPVLVDFIKAHQGNAVNCPPADTSSFILEDEQMNALADHCTGRESLNPPYPGVADAAGSNRSFYEEFKFFSKIRLFSVAGSITVITAVMGAIISG